jgi:hypothetical protein
LRTSVTAWRGTTDAILNGPVPAGPSAAVLPQSLPPFSNDAGEVKRTYGTIQVKNEATTVVVIDTVWSSIFFQLASSGRRARLMPAAGGSNCGASLLKKRSRFQTTASALKSVPSWNFTPLRR